LIVGASYGMLPRVRTPAAKVCQNQAAIAVFRGNRMKADRTAIVARLLLAGTVLALCIQPSMAQQSSARHTLDMTLVKPEAVGFSSVRLERLHTLMQQTVDKKQLAGVVTILARHGKVVDYRTYGQRDMASGTAITKDTIFRDYSMTKPVTGVAMMILYEQGKWLPSDPISKYVPEFAQLKVFKGVDADGKMILVEPDHAPTMRELMTHTAGFTYGSDKSPADAMYGELKVRQSKDLQEMIDRIAKIPLLYQPGKAWVYSMSMDIEGYIVEKLSGQSLPDFMRDQIFNPLGMKDAGFYVPEEKRKRFATLYENDQQGGLKVDTSNGGGMGDFLTPPAMPSGGGGIVSTTEDYYRFAQMLANDGELNGARILAPGTVRLMTANHVPVSLLTGDFGIGLQVLRPGLGYGYNCAALYDPLEANMPDGKGSFFWDGAAGTWFWVDPTNDIVFVGMIQRMRGGSPTLRT
jgi:CubicO group peptidase (beta-lactamase class C family)